MASVSSSLDFETLKITELLKEVELEYSPATLKSVNDVVSSIRDVIHNIPEGHQVNADVAPNFVRGIGADKVDFKFKRPVSVEIGGSFEYRCVAKPDVSVDLFVQLPKECFLEKDFLNHRYHAKRGLYLCILENHLKLSSSFKKIEWSTFQNEARKPILVVYPATQVGIPDFSVRLIPTAKSLFLLQKLNVERNNVRSVNQATPLYNSSLLEDMVLQQNSEFISRTASGWKALRDAVILLKVWARQRSAIYTHDCLNGHLISTIIAYLATESGRSRINNSMTSMQMFRITLDFIATSKVWDTGMFLKPQGGESSMSKEERKKFLQSFPVVICDSLAQFNLAFRMTKNGLLQLQEEAAVTLSCLAKCRDGGFDEVFMTKIDFPSKFDFCLRLNLEGFAQVYASGYCGDNECWRLYENKVQSLLQNGLGDRAKFVRVSWRNAASNFNVHDDLSVLDREPLIVGISLSLPEALKVVTKGPTIDNKDEARKFREFWGDKAEVRQFATERTTRECVSWECKLAERHLIIKWISGYVLRRHLSLAEEKIIHAVDQLDFSLVRANADVEYSIGSLIEVFDNLSKRLRLLSDIPLKVSSVQPLDSAFRHTSVFPPRPHPLAYEKNVGTKVKKLFPTCIQPMDVMIQVEGSGNWPMDDIATEKTKTAFLLKIAESLYKSWGMKYAAAEEDVTVFLSGYAFRLKILHERGLSLLKGQSRSDQGKRVFSADRKLFLMSQHSSMINGLCGRYPIYEPVVRLAKRWVSSHLFSASFTEEAIELVVAYLFLSPLPFSAPCSRISGFIRFLRFLSNHDWTFSPLVVDINDDLSADDKKQINENFMLSRKANEEGTGSLKSAMFIATSYDKASEAWTSSSPSLLEIKRLSAYASSSSNLLTRLIMQRQLDSYGWECTFGTPLNNYDAVILLHRDKLPYPERLLFPSELSNGKLVARGNASKIFHPFMLPGEVQRNVEELKDKPLIDFDPLRFFVKDLESGFPEMFKLWYDSFGGDAIGLTLKKENLKKRGRGRGDIGDEEKVVVDALKDVGEAGKGLVRSIHLLKVPKLTN